MGEKEPEWLSPFFFFFFFGQRSRKYRVAVHGMEQVVGAFRGERAGVDTV